MIDGTAYNTRGDNGRENIHSGGAYARVGFIAFLVLLLSILLLPSCALAVQISEVCAKNKTAYKAANGTYPDYIELWNSDSEYASLDGWYLSDDSDNPYLASLSGRGIDAGGYLLLLADNLDLPFELSAAGETLILTNEKGETVQELKFPQLGDDQVYSLSSDGTYGISSPTPNAENKDAPEYIPPVPVVAPRFSKAAGFYDEPFYLEIITPADDRIYYTLDGSEPTESSALYTAPIYIDDASFHKNNYSARTDISVLTVTAPKALQVKGTVLRAAAIDENGNKSSITTGTYFIGFQNRQEYSGLPVISISVDPELMFGEEIGMYMLGYRYKNWLESTEYSPDTATNSIPANYKIHGTEIKADVEWFEADGTLSLSQTLGLRIHGNFSRHDVQKSLKLYARSIYGDNKIQYVFWEEAGKNEHIVLRNGGNNHVLTFLDTFAHKLLSRRGLPYSRSLPCLAYINGEFWGLYNIRESEDEDFIEQYCGIDDEDIIMIKNQALQEGVPSDLDDFKAMIKTISEMNCVSDKAYDYVNSLIDIDNYTNYLAGGICIQCVDWLNIDNNSTLWRTRKTDGGGQSDGRWRWIYQDLDYSCGWGHSDPTPVQLLLKEPIFSALWTNAGYRQKFLTTVMDIANIDCAASRVNALVDSLASVYRVYNPLNYSRFSLDYTLETFDTQAENIKKFFAERPEQLAAELSDALNIQSGCYTLSVSVSGTSIPDISVNGNAIELVKNKWNGIYFAGCPITLKAGEMTGYDFSGWYSKNTLLSANAEITVELAGKLELSPVYTRRDFIAELASDMQPRQSDGDVLLGTGQYSYSARLVADAGLAASVSNGAVLLLPEKKWQKKLGFEISFSSAGYTSIRAELELYLSEDAPKEWRVLAGESGSELKATEEGIKLQTGKNRFTVSLPESASDIYSAVLRLEAVKKSSGTDEMGVSINALCIYGDEAKLSTAALQNAIRLCESEMGKEFTAPDDAEISALSAAEVAALTRSLYKRLASFSLKSRVREISAEDAALNAALEGLNGCIIADIAADDGLYSNEVDISVGFNGLAYLYKISENIPEYAGEYSAAENTITIPSDEGKYLILSKPIAGYRYKAEIINHEIGESLQALIGGEVDEPYAFLKIERYTEYQESMRFSVPEESGLYGKSIRIYSVSENALELKERVKAQGGEYTIEPLDSGEYLILLSSPEHYRYLSGDNTEKTKSETKNTKADQSRLPLLIAAGAGALVLTIIVLLIVKSRSKKKR